MAEGLSRRIEVRAEHKASVTRMLNQIDGILAEEPPDVSKLSQSLEEKYIEVLRLTSRPGSWPFLRLWGASATELSKLAL